MKLGLIGKNIQSSQAPDIHKRIGNLFKIPVSYQIFDLKEILDNSQGGESFKQAWNKDFSWLELNDNISSQLRRNAERE